MNLEKQLEILETVALELDGELLKNYSGRFMYGAKCYAIVADDPIHCIEQVASKGITGARYDQMGLQYVIYWPDIMPIVRQD